MRLHDRLNNSDCTSSNAVAKGQLFDVGAFPAARFSGEGKIIGEVYSVSPQILLSLDWTEGFLRESKKDSMYWRRRITVDTDTGPQIVFAYEWNRSMDNLLPIESGDYKLHMKENYAD